MAATSHRTGVNMPKAAMVGAGLIGRSWSIVFARAGWDVALYDSVTAVTDQAHAKVTEGLTELKAHGLIDDVGAAA